MLIQSVSESVSLFSCTVCTSFLSVSLGVELASVWIRIPVTGVVHQGHGSGGFPTSCWAVGGIGNVVVVG